MFCPKCGEKVENNQAYCNRCGNRLQIEQKTNVMNNLIGIIIGVIVLAIIFVCMLIFDNSNYYFSTNDYDDKIEDTEEIEDTDKTEEEEDDGEKEDNEIINTNENKTTKNKGKYTTVIVADNRYTGIKIENEKDAYELIIEDSVKQKQTTSKEIKDIENRIINKYGITAVNLCELDVEFAKELEKVFEKIYKEYPSVRGDLTNLSLINAPISDSYIAAFMPAFNFATSDSRSGHPWVMKTQVLLNTMYFLNTARLESSVTAGSNAGHFPPNATIYSPVAHELGHYLSFLAMMKHYDVDSILLIDNDNINDYYKLLDDFCEGKFSLLMIKEAYNNYQKDVNTSLTIDEWRATISAYAVAKDNNGNYIYDETIAEAFHDIYLNGDNAKAASKYVVDVLKQKLNR